MQLSSAAYHLWNPFNPVDGKAENWNVGIGGGLNITNATVDESPVHYFPWSEKKETE